MAFGPLELGVTITRVMCVVLLSALTLESLEVDVGSVARCIASEKVAVRLELRSTRLWPAPSEVVLTFSGLRSFSLEGSYVAEGCAVAIAVQGPANAPLISGWWRAADGNPVYGCAAWLQGVSQGETAVVGQRSELGSACDLRTARGARELQIEALGGGSAVAVGATSEGVGQDCGPHIRSAAYVNISARWGRVGA